MTTELPIHDPAAPSRPPGAVASWGGFVAAVAVGAFIAWAGSHASVAYAPLGWPLFAALGLLAYLIQWVVFVPSFIASTEHYYDLTGSLTYILLAICAWALGHGDERALLLMALILIWAIRLGSFLFIRVRADGRDARFDKIKRSFPAFLMAWSLQALWVFITAGAALAAMTSAHQAPMGWVAAIGFIVWVGGFAIEVIADKQKRTFRDDPANEGRYITNGLWAWSRHPNYFGEILLWLGIAIIALPVLSGWQLVTLISPVFVVILLTQISGIPMLERRARKRWGDEEAWQTYQRNTPALIPKPPRKSTTSA